MYIHIYTHMCIYTYTYTYTHPCAYIYIYLCIYMYVCMSMCMCMCIYIYIYMYTHISSRDAEAQNPATRQTPASHRAAQCTFEFKHQGLFFCPPFIFGCNRKFCFLLWGAFAFLAQVFSPPTRTQATPLSTGTGPVPRGGDGRDILPSMCFPKVLPPMYPASSKCVSWLACFTMNVYANVYVYMYVCMCIYIGV